MTSCPGGGCPIRDNCRRYFIRRKKPTVDPIRREDGSCGFFWRVPIREGNLRKIIFRGIMSR